MNRVTTQQKEIVSNGVVPMPLLFRSCIQEMDSMMAPLHYEKITILALDNLGLTPKDVEMVKVKEDVREKLLDDERRGAAYIGRPYCVGFLKKWLPSEQLLLMNPDTDKVNIGIGINSAVEGSVETVKRFPYMLDKRNEKCWKNVSSAPENLLRFRLEKLILEQSVTDYFKERWPKYWRPPSNCGDYTKPASDDFKLQIKNKAYKVDIATKNRNGKVGNVRMKRSADVHVVVKKIKKGVALCGFVPGSKFKNSFLVEQTNPISWLIFWLNCLDEYGLTFYKEVRAISA